MATIKYNERNNQTYVSVYKNGKFVKYLGNLNNLPPEKLNYLKRKYNDK